MENENTKPPNEAEAKKKEAKEIVGCVEYANEYGAEYLVPEPEKPKPEK